MPTFTKLLLFTLKLTLTQLLVSPVAPHAINPSSPPKLERSLPEKLVVAYQSWSECDDKVLDAVQSGVNVVIWFATNLESADDGSALMAGGPNRTCVQEKIEALEELGYGRDKVTHLISVGGWDASHPDTSNTAEEYFEAFEKFSDGLYDGLDWDLEGNDSLTSQLNYFSKECLLLMGDLSQLLHDAGYIVSMAPPESYLDIQTTEVRRAEERIDGLGMGGLHASRIKSILN